MYLLIVIPLSASVKPRFARGSVVRILPCNNKAKIPIAISFLLAVIIDNAHLLTLPFASPKPLALLIHHYDLK